MLQGERDGAVEALQERAATLDALNGKLTSVGDALANFEHELAVRPPWGAHGHYHARRSLSCDAFSAVGFRAGSSLWPVETPHI